MGIMHSEMTGRLDHWMRTLKNDFYKPLGRIDWTSFTTMDELSFEEFEVEYKYLKAVLEGGLESRPDNVLIYATSNRRHLVREHFSDREERDDDTHANETVQEKISLCARFGLSIYYGSPAQEEVFKIVEELAARYGIDKDKETLRLEANRWEITHNGFSGRTATQFIDHLRGKAGTA